mmetsp:Transcript_24349/g.51656  ORF Transcript_24349/g.51656 Transcript_24349/m.51656 type:complete len:80 (-) Transcript_24349:1899-2138(-)
MTSCAKCAYVSQLFAPAQISTTLVWYMISLSMEWKRLLVCVCENLVFFFRSFANKSDNESYIEQLDSRKVTTKQIYPSR